MALPAPTSHPFGGSYGEFYYRRSMVINLMNCFRCFPLVALLTLAVAGHAQQNPNGLYNNAMSKAQDVFTPLDPSEVRFTGGLLGERFGVNEKARLLEIDEHELLDPFEHREKDHQDWAGEHVGKFLHAATLAWRNTADPSLKAKIDRVAARLMATQESDGYLGTYREDKKWTRWDVWVHKYDLLGLLTYWQYTKNSGALTTCRKVGDLLSRTFGTGPGQRDINKAGEHVGMAACSVLEPLVLLYRATSEARYLALANYIVSNYDAPTGPKILTSLEKTHSVRQVANGKAYEMTSNFNGLLELYRLTGERRLVDDMKIAWMDIVDRRINAAGTGSTYEIWNDDGSYPNDQSKDVGETCVSVTWEQMCLQLLRLTGDGAIADQLERTVYNALLGAQKEDGASWCYYTSLNGLRPYGKQLTCCISSGARGVALLPSVTAMKSRDGGLVVNLYNNSEVQAVLPSGRVQLTQSTEYPFAGDVNIRVISARANQSFPLRLRIPAWSEGAELAVDGKPFDLSKGVVNGYAVLNRSWKKESRIHLRFSMKPTFIDGIDSNVGAVAAAFGPLVFAADSEINPDISDLTTVSLASRDVRVEGSTEGPNRTFHLVATAKSAKGDSISLNLAPFAIAGRDGKSHYVVWLRAP